MSRFRTAPSSAYPYLWRWQAEEGRDHAPKNRPVCLVLSIPSGGLTHLVLLAVSGTPPRAGQRALAVPALELRRAGLSEAKDGWVTVDEFNYDVAERSFHLDPSQPPLGRFSRRFMADIRAALRPALVAARARIDRTR